MSATVTTESEDSLYSKKLGIRISSSTRRSVPVVITSFSIGKALVDLGRRHDEGMFGRELKGKEPLYIVDVYFFPIAAVYRGQSYGKARLVQIKLRARNQEESEPESRCRV